MPVKGGVWKVQRESEEALEKVDTLYDRSDGEEDESEEADDIYEELRDEGQEAYKEAAQGMSFDELLASVEKEAGAKNVEAQVELRWARSKWHVPGLA